MLHCIIVLVPSFTLFHYIPKEDIVLSTFITQLITFRVKCHMGPITYNPVYKICCNILNV